MEIPEQWRDYPCEDYYSTALATNGLWDEAAQHWLIEPAERVVEHPRVQFLQVGGPGVDGISFGYRKGQPGFWAYHQMVADQFQYLANSVQEFLKGWRAGKITV